MIIFFYFIKWFVSLFMAFILPEKFLPILLCLIAINEIDICFNKTKFGVLNFLKSKRGENMESYALLAVVLLSLFLFVKNSCDNCDDSGRFNCCKASKMDKVQNTLEEGCAYKVMDPLKKVDVVEEKIDTQSLKQKLHNKLQKKAIVKPSAKKEEEAKK